LPAKNRDGHWRAGTPIDVGIDYATLDTGGHTVDLAIFHIVSLDW
jgi:hypothetical protein